MEITINKNAKIGKALLQDVKEICGSIYTMNAPNSIGYGFDKHYSGKSIARGMFIDFESEIKDWDYYLDYKTGVISKTADNPKRIYF